LNAIPTNFALFVRRRGDLLFVIVGINPCSGRDLDRRWKAIHHCVHEILHPLF
jgi:hypothetical protein